MPVSFDETTMLLPRSNSNGSEEDDDFPAVDVERESIKAMKKVVHNDPGVDEDVYEQLWGSTTLLKNSIKQDLPSYKKKENLFS